MIHYNYGQWINLECRSTIDVSPKEAGITHGTSDAGERYFMKLVSSE